MEDLALKVEHIARRRLRIWLTEEELQAWGIRFRQLGESRVQTERLLHKVMPSVRQFFPSSVRVSVEAIPVEGGCVLLVGTEGLRAGGPLVCRVEQLDALYALAEQWLSQETAPVNNSLYLMEDAYLLVLYPVEPLSLRRQALLREYGNGTVYGEAAAAYADEYGRLLVAGEAMKALTGCASGPQALPDQTH